MGNVPEHVFMDAARGSVLAHFPGRPAFAATVQVDVDEPGFRAAVASAYRAGQAATPDGPHRWVLPDEPGPEVTAVRNKAGGTWDRDGRGWRWRIRDQHIRESGINGSWYTWRSLITTEGTLTDATPAADGQDGRDG